MSEAMSVHKGDRISIQGSVIKVMALQTPKDGTSSWKRRDLFMHDTNSNQRILIKYWNEKVKLIENVTGGDVIHLKNFKVGSYHSMNNLNSYNLTRIHVESHETEVILTSTTSPTFNMENISK